MLFLKDYQKRALHALRDYLALTRENGAKVAFSLQTERVYHTVPQLPGLPYVCLRIPTGGGKTIMACHAISIAGEEFLRQDKSVVLWLVPTNAIKTQTLAALRNLHHPYRRALDTTLGGNVAVLDLTQAQYVKRTTLDAKTTIIISTLAALRVEDTVGRKVYEQNGNLMSHFEDLPDEITAPLEKYEDGQPVPSLGNVLKMRRPIMIVDEAHNARTPLSFETLARFSPSCVLEFTATPDQEHSPSNVLYHVSAHELKAEDMIKLPIRLVTHTDWKETIATTKEKREQLEVLAQAERVKTGEYIRPIALLQAQPKRKIGNGPTVDVAKKALLDLGVPLEQIAIEVGGISELANINVLSEGCPIRYIITVDKLREGWDCPFAYVLCSIREMASRTAVEQVLGRVLRMPAATRKTDENLNRAYAFVTSRQFREAAENLADALVSSGLTKFEATREIEQSHPELPGLDNLGGLFLDGEMQHKSPSEKGVRFYVPQLALFEDDFIEPLDDSHFLPGIWNLSQFDATLGEDEFRTLRPSSDQAEIDVTSEGRASIRLAESTFVSNLQQQLTQLVPNDTMSLVDLAVWLDRQVPHPDVTQVHAQRFIMRLLEHLTEKRGLSIEFLTKERLRLRDAVTRKIARYRQQLKGEAYQKLLFDEPPTQLQVSPKCAFEFDPLRYPANPEYTGRYQFSKHYYAVIGAMNSEEADCAQLLDTMQGVKHWVRNIERRPDLSFWLPTPTDRFYPDFVAELTNNCILAVEYKGSHLITSDDTKEKRNIGGLWERRSAGKCIFRLVGREDFQNILQNVAA